MSIHENLLRLHRRQLDERRRYTAELEALSERLRADLGLLTAAIALEAATLENPPESQGDNRSVAPKLRERHTKLEHSVAELESHIVATRDDIAAAEHEIAAYELAAAHRKPVGRAVSFRLTQTDGATASPIFARRVGS
jgi:flagellar protein FliJ